MSDAWYYEQDGKSVGPVPFEQLKSELLKRSDWRDQLVWRAGESDWIKAGDIPELTNTPPPLPLRQTTSPTLVRAKEPEPQQFLYNALGVVISPTLARFGNATYPINGIGSVRVDPPRRQGLIAGAVIIGGLGLLSISGDKSTESTSALGVIMFLVAIACLIRAFNIPYRLMLRTASGDQQAFVSKKREELEKMKQAIEKAVVQRG